MAPPRLLLLVSLALLLLVTATARRQLIRQKGSRHLLPAEPQTLTVDALPQRQEHNLPVFFFHGVLSNARSGYRFAANLTAEGRVFVPLTFCDDRCSIQALNAQVQLAIKQIRGIVKDDKRFEDGYVFIAHSQGGAIARAVIEEMDDHKVRTFVSLAGVVNGVFYGPQPADALPAAVFLKALGPNMVPPSVWDANAYSLADFNGSYQYDLDVFARTHPELQSQYSAFNLARSPVPGPWIDVNPFFPVQNNLNLCSGDGATQCLRDQQRRRANFLKLKAAHFFASPDDGVVAPWQSSILGQYSELKTEEEIKTEFTTLTILDMKDTREYKEDTYGLLTLNARGGLYLHTVPSVTHTCWVTDSAPFGSVHPCFFDEVYDEHLYPLI
ncbi:Lysosomal thioesterase ppt2 [Globisporangium polare]